MTSPTDHSPGISAFLAVLRTGSTLAAAKELDISQATVARRVRNLERTLDVMLFSKDTRGSRPTPQARVLQHAAMEVGESIAQFSRIANELRAEENGNITIGGPSPVFDLEVSDMLSEFVTKYPGTKFNIRASNKKEEVYDGTADVVFTFGRMPDDPDTICRRAGTLQNGFYAAHEYAAINGLPASEVDLGEHKFIRIVGKEFPPSIVDWISKHVRDEQIVTEVTNLETLFTVIKMGQGIGPLPSIYGDPMDGVVRAFPPPRVLDMPSWLAISPHATHRPNVRKFVEFFAPQFKRLMNSRM